jgi:hypothetical protein
MDSSRSELRRSARWRNTLAQDRQGIIGSSHEATREGMGTA